MQQIQNGALIVIADGAGARFLRNEGTTTNLVFRQEGAMSPTELENGGPSGSRPVEQTPRQTDEATFSKQLANWLHRQLLAGTYENLVLVADPQTLGQIRNAMDISVKARIVLTLNKELTGHSLEDISVALGRASQQA